MRIYTVCYNFEHFNHISIVQYKVQNNSIADCTDISLIDSSRGWNAFEFYYSIIMIGAESEPVR